MSKRYGKTQLYGAVRYGKTQLYEAVRLSLNNLHGFDLSVRQVRTITDEVLSCAVHGLFEYENLVIEKLGSFSVLDRDEPFEERPYDLSLPRRVAYRPTKFIREMLKGD